MMMRDTLKRDLERAETPEQRRLAYNVERLREEGVAAIRERNLDMAEASIRGWMAATEELRRVVEVNEGRDYGPRL